MMSNFSVSKIADAIHRNIEKPIATSRLT